MIPHMILLLLRAMAEYLKINFYFLIIFVCETRTHQSGKKWEERKYLLVEQNFYVWVY